MATAYQKPSRDYDTPSSLAWRMAGYQRDAAYIHAMVRREYGRAPDVPAIAAMIEERAKEKVPREHFTGPRAYNPENDNGEPFKPRSLVPTGPARRVRPARPIPPPKAPVARKEPWPAWYSPPKAPAFFSTDLIGLVAYDFGFTAEELTGKKRSPELVDARSVVARILRERDWSYAKLGRAIGGRDHSTAINLVTSFDIYAKRNPLVQASYERHRNG